VIKEDCHGSLPILGYLAHEELAYLVGAGLTPYEALRAGTHDAALVLGHLDEFGTVAVGRRADLLLLEASPLDDVSHAGQIDGVMVRGRWLSQGELRPMLDGLKASFAPTVLERLWLLSLVCAAAFLIWRWVLCQIHGSASIGCPGAKRLEVVRLCQ
jgi:hypothetical protein